MSDNAKRAVEVLSSGWDLGAIDPDSDEGWDNPEHAIGIAQVHATLAVGEAVDRLAHVLASFLDGSANCDGPGTVRHREWCGDERPSRH
jgi:hypothetical protein